MTSERKNEREFGIYNAIKDKFYNLDYLNSFDEQDEFVDQPERNFTYEECERFIVHKSEKEALTILNILQPKFLLAFQLDFLRKQFVEKLNKETQRKAKIRNEQIQTVNSTKAEVQKNKQSFYHDLQSWELDINSQQTQMSGKFGEKLKNKPKIESYNLSSDHFTSDEKFQLKNKYEIVV